MGAGQLRFLVVDDFATMRRILRFLLTSFGFTNVDEAEDGVAALHKLKTEKFDFVLSDWNMPKMTGIDLLSAIRADDALKSLPVLMISAERSKEHIEEAARSGANGYMVKPFTAAALRDEIDMIFNTQRNNAAA